MWNITILEFGRNENVEYNLVSSSIQLKEKNLFVLFPSFFSRIIVRSNLRIKRTLNCRKFQTRKQIEIEKKKKKKNVYHVM